MLLKFRNGSAVTTFVKPVAAGGTGATTAANARTNLGVTAANMGISDYVVQQGTSGIWTYRKWSSGVARVLGRHQHGEREVHQGEQHDGATECEWKGSFLFPFSFTARPTVTVTQNDADWANSISSIAVTASAFISVSFNKFNTAGGTAGFNVSLGVEARGRWK